MYQRLPNGCEIVRGSGLGFGIEVGLMQTEIPGKPEAWLYWFEGQSITSERSWKYGTRADAIVQLNVWLELIGLALEQNAQGWLTIVEH